ncbi:hypothetical protein [Methanoregula sp. PtaU1.Bin006]|nr:hypothetical protein [Methanoregula sp. PtaU1.Bin006]
MTDIRTASRSDPAGIRYQILSTFVAMDISVTWQNARPRYPLRFAE